MAASGSSDSVGGYSVAFLTTEQQERFAAIRIKLCENKAVDIEDLEKHGMHDIVEAIQRMKWTRMVTVSEPSYPDLAKAFYTCLKSEEDGSLSSTVKGTHIHITYDLLERLFGVSTVGHSGVNSVDSHAKGLGIIGIEYKLKDGKIDINQLNAFNRILHFIVCQILVPRSATFSTCPKGDSDMMFWAIQNQDINMAQVIIEMMKSAAEMIWDKKNKLVVSLPYAQLLTRNFKDYGIDLKGEVMEKMGQPIQSRNLKKSGFSLVGNIWTKNFMAEGEAIIGEAPEIPPVLEAEAEVRIKEPPASVRRIEEISPALIEPVGQSTERVIPSTVPAPTIEESVILETVTHAEGEQENTLMEDIPNVPSAVVSMEGSMAETIPEVVAPGHTEDILMEDAPAQGEPEIQGEPTASAPADQFQEGIVEDVSDEDMEPIISSGGKRKESGPSGPFEVEDVGTRPSGLAESVAEPVRSQAPIEVAAVPPEPAVPSNLQTLAPSSLPTSFSAPPAPEPSKKSLPKHISSPTPFPATSSSSPISSTAIPPPPTFEEPPASSSAGPSSAGPSAARPSAPPPPTSFSSLHPPTPPSFITIIPEGARVPGHIIQDIKEEFEEAILRSVLSVSSHDPFAIWVERYKVYVPLKKDLLQHKIFYPISIDKFLQHASFGTTSLYRSSFGKDEYVNFIETQRQLHIQRLLPDMGPSYNISWGAFKNFFEEQELQAWPIITHHASLLSPAFYISDPH
ncbi:hypothetical protein Taro_046736 [Colocasia esculenta]|uniref:Putative plant transposon protein domain-containing protein n=1 Tax=Colocasia esculenta TaxID=4460 RepID=A0A843X7K8_COLES|nr:hypothetical protein [Colocasia esculenta]